MVKARMLIRCTRTRGLFLVAQMYNILNVCLGQKSMDDWIRIRWVWNECSLETLSAQWIDVESGTIRNQLSSILSQSKICPIFVYDGGGLD